MSTYLPSFSEYLKMLKNIPFLKILILITLVRMMSPALADDCAKLAQLTGGICVTPPITDQTDPDWEQMFASVILNALISSIQPSIITMSPSQLPQSGTANFSLLASKTNFSAGSQVVIGGGITATITSIKSSNEILLNITAPVSTSPDYYDITVNTGSEQATGIGVLRITPASSSPEILSISPTIVAKSSTMEMQIYGNNQTNFSENSTVKFAAKQANNSFIEDAGITAQVKIATPNLLTITANVTAAASIGLHNVTVITDAEQAVDNNQLGSLRINEYNTDFAEITSVSPNYASQGDTITVNIAGSSVQFVDGQSMVKFGGSGMEVISTTVISPTQASAEVQIAGNAPLGVRDVYITTGAEIAQKLEAFAVFSPASISLNTSQGQQGKNVQLMITGERTNFAQDVSQINFTGSGITVSSINVINSTTIIATIQIASNADSTTRDMSVVTDEEVVALISAFTVTEASSESTSTSTNGTIQFSQENHTVDETENSIILKLERLGNNDDKVTVKYVINDDTATVGEDFEEATEDTLTWEAGDSTDKEITIAIVDDEQVEDDESFTVELMEIVGEANLGTAIATITITSDDESTSTIPSTIQFSQESYDAEEVNGKATLIVQRLDSSVGQVTVNYATSDGTAKAGEDFVSVDTGSLTWEDGDGEDKEIIIAITNDELVEDDESFTVELMDINGEASFGTATITISSDDDEPKPTPIIQDEPATKTEDPSTIPKTEGTTSEPDVTTPTTPLPIDKVEKPVTSDKSQPTGDSTLTGKSELPLVEEVGTPTTTGEQNTSINISTPSSPVYAPLCFSTGNINRSCNAGDRIITDVVIAENISISHAIFDDTVENYGRISNSTFTSTATANGGIFSGYIINEGILADFEFRGRSIVGGILAGIVKNTSEVGGFFQDVTLAADTHIIGGILEGNIIGNANQPARLEALIIRSGSHLENVIIGADVELGENVTLGTGVQFVNPNHVNEVVELLELGNAVAINAQGEFIPTQATFAGDALVNGDGLVDIHGSITVDANDVGKLADILIVVYSSTQSSYYMLDLEGEMEIWDKNISSLKSYNQEIYLDTIQVVQVSSILLDTSGMVNIYFGYRLEDGTIVYNSQAIDIVIEIE